MLKDYEKKKKKIKQIQKMKKSYKKPSFKAKSYAYKYGQLN